MSKGITLPQLESTTTRITTFLADSLKSLAEDIENGGSSISINNATTVENGLMSSVDKIKLNNIDAGAQVNVIESVKVNDETLSVTNKAVNIDLSGYVAKETDKGLSSNDFTDTYKDKLDGIASGAEVNVIESVKVNDTALSVTNKAVNIDLSGYVTKETDKGLSTNDFTTAYKTKLDGIDSGANSYTLPTASSNTLGGVKIGDNITSTNGTISLSKTNVTDALGYTPPTTNTTYGTGNTTTAGLTKLYTGTGTNVDGTMTQNAITTALDGKLDTGGTVAAATKATNDGNGNAISSTYLKLRAC